MKKKRLIPILLLKDGNLVQAHNFKFYQNLGNPEQAVKRLSEWGSDELIYLDISKKKHDIGRSDTKYKSTSNFLNIVKKFSKFSFMPTTIGGNIKNLLDVEKRLLVGADKVSINSAVLINPKLISDVAKEFGSQCLVISIDVKKINGKYKIFFNHGVDLSKYSLKEWLKIIQNNGAGEILINSIDRDGSKEGYDINLLKSVTRDTKMPVIACGGVGTFSDFYEGFKKTKIDAAAAANIFHYSDQSVFLAKNFLYKKKIKVRKPYLLDIN
tara:strand:- start:1633 stop:2439 length:807 start_codon:yes stop_codon:yes gene_type:complete